MYNNLLQAVEVCYKALKALRTFPTLTEHVWLFIERLLLRISSKKPFTYVDTAIAGVEKLYRADYEKNFPDGPQLPIRQDFPDF